MKKTSLLLFFLFTSLLLFSQKVTRTLLIGQFSDALYEHVVDTNSIKLQELMSDSVCYLLWGEEYNEGMADGKTLVDSILPAYLDVHAEDIKLVVWDIGMYGKETQKWGGVLLKVALGYKGDPVRQDHIMITTTKEGKVVCISIHKDVINRPYYDPIVGHIR